jgi:hypothetical protein
MATESRLVKLLIEKLAHKVGQSLDMAGYKAMSDFLERELKTTCSIDHRYLHDVYTRVSKKDQLHNMADRTSRVNLDKIAKAIGYEDYQGFINEADKPLDKFVKAVLGNWWSIARANKGAYLLKAPVKIYQSKNKEPRIELQGEHHLFKGVLHHRSGNIFCELDSDESKKLFIVLKVGNSINPQLIQGVFTGVSTAGDPVAGRELFYRAEEGIDFKEMKWEKVPLEKTLQDERINQYFNTYEGNCLKINEASTFTLTDLEK